jgi:hypothetical protein
MARIRTKSSVHPNAISSHVKTASKSNLTWAAFSIGEGQRKSDLYMEDSVEARRADKQIPSTSNAAVYVGIAVFKSEPLHLGDSVISQQRARSIGFVFK